MQDQNTTPTSSDSSDPLQSPAASPAASSAEATPSEPDQNLAETPATEAAPAEPPESKEVSPASVPDSPSAGPAPGGSPEPAAPADTTPTADSTPPPPAVMSTGGGRRPLVVGLVLVVLAVIVAGGAYAWVSRNRDKAPVKQDIPSLSYAVREAGMQVNYPNNTNSSSSDQVLTQLFEGLVRYQNQTKIVPLLATGWTNPDNNDWVFTLRQGAKFHSGRPFTSADVKSSLDYAVAHQSDEDGSTTMALASTIKSVTTMGAYKVKITTDGPDPTLLNRLASLFITDSKAKVGDPDAGTGPYIIKPGTTPSGTAVSLKAVNDYWGGHVYTREVKFIGVTDVSKLTSATAAGKYDIAGFFPVSEISKLHPVQTVVAQDAGVSFLGLNTHRPGSPLTSLAARQAVSYALDVPAIMKAGGVDGEQASQLIPTTIPGHDPSIANVSQNLEKAKKLLATVPNASAPITLSYGETVSGAAQEIAKELTAAGFTVKTQPESSINALVGIALSGKTDMYHLSYDSDILDGLDIIDSLVLGNANFSDDSITALATQASSVLDPATRIHLLQQIEQKIAAQVPDVPLYTQTLTFVVTKHYKNITNDIPTTQAGLYLWKVYQ